MDSISSKVNEFFDLQAISIKFENEDVHFKTKLSNIMIEIRNQQYIRNDINEKILIFNMKHPDDFQLNNVSMPFTNNFSIKQYMEMHFGTDIEDSLYQIQNERIRMERNLAKDKLDIETDDQYWIQSDLSTFQGCCYYMATLLFQNYKKRNNKQN